MPTTLHKVGKGTFNCPLSLINHAATTKGKARIVLGWRMLSPKQQREKLDALFDNQLSDVFHHTDGEVLNVAILYAGNSLCKLCRIIDHLVFDDILPNVAGSTRYLIVVLVKSSPL